ncbi:MAG: MoaD/ThiS family protein [Candidatus Bathyarchaeota archaeon]|nr:MoaD/ThiS family protein [Candidatus Bathyarchaeota archaeon]
MVVTVKFVGALRILSGKTKLAIEIKDDVPLRQILKKIVEKRPKLKRVLVDPELEDPRLNTLILVNGKEINVLDGLETLLKDGDEIVFVPILHGG